MNDDDDNDDPKYQSTIFSSFQQPRKRSYFSMHFHSILFHLIYYYYWVTMFGRHFNSWLCIVIPSIENVLRDFGACRFFLLFNYIDFYLKVMHFVVESITEIKKSIPCADMYEFWENTIVIWMAIHWAVISKPYIGLGLRSVSVYSI